jgi:hypothetical protein
MAIKVDIDKLISDYKKGGHKTNFPDSLRNVLKYAQTIEGNVGRCGCNPISGFPRAVPSIGSSLAPLTQYW